MPTYEYECTKCKHRFEEFQKITDKPLTNCPRCQGKLRRLISGGAGLIFKGTGFYATDYKKPHLPDVKKGERQLQKTEDKSKLPAEKPTETPEKKDTESS